MLRRGEGPRMPKLTDREASGKRLVLGFDGGCSACGELARRIEERLAGRLEVCNLREPLIQEWCKKALGEDLPLTPTLFEVRGQEVVRAWTGWRLGANLGRFLGPADTWRVMQALGEVEGYTAGTEGSSAGYTGAFGDRLRLTRGQFLKGMGGAAVAMSALSAAGSLGSPAEAAQSPASGALARSRDEAVGASLSHPAEWEIEREPFTFEDTQGFTLWKPKQGSSKATRDQGGHEDHDKTPAVRVALAYGLEPAGIEERVRNRLATYSDLPAVREEVEVGRGGLDGVAVGPIPGSTPSTEVYVAVDERVYQITVYGETLDAAGKKLLLGLDFGPPSQSARSATSTTRLPDANAPELLYAAHDPQLVEREQSAKIAARSKRSAEEASQRSVSAQSGEAQLSEGCWKAPSGFFFQTQHGSLANKHLGANEKGFTRIGIPNYWDEYTHGSLGYGRCVSNIYTNDKYAIDYPLGTGDAIFSPFKSGTVTFAGRNKTHKDYGIFVSIKSDDGKYVNMSAHLSGVAQGISRGTRVTDETVIGYAGNSGGPNIPVGDPHLHQAYYRYPSFNPDGSPYGGAALKVQYHHYVGDAAGTGPGVYKFGKKSNDKNLSKGDRISN